MQLALRALTICLAVLGVTACEPQVGLPPEAADARGVVPKAARDDFDLIPQVRIATRACVQSELTGPASLSGLLSQGYSPIKEYGVVLYARLGKTTGTVRVIDPKAATPCRIEVFRNKGYTALAAVQDEVTLLGYKPVTVGKVTRYIGKGQRFDIVGTTSTYSPHASINIRRIDPKTDRLCRDTALPVSAREGC
jgi:hypothetical protein